MNIHYDRIKELQKLMEAEGMALYFIPMDDCHMSEYVAEHFRCINYISGFSGSAAELLVSRDAAYLFTDGRYYIQAERELSGSGAVLMKAGTPGVPSVGALAKTLINEGEALGFDGNVVNAAYAEDLKKEIGKNITIKCGRDLAGEIWKDRPAQEFTDIWEYEEKYSGESCADKLSRIRKELAQKAEAEDYLYVMSSLDDIAWTFNIRADDIACNPVAFAYAKITKNTAVLYINGKISAELSENLKKQGVSFGSYGVSYVCTGAEKGETVFLDKARTSFNIYNYYEGAGAKIVDIKDPPVFMKALKNETEIKNTKAAYIKDSIRLIRFMKWIKELAAKAAPGETITEGGTFVTEITVDEKLQELRQQNGGYFEPSFDTIAAYGPNAAMMHYQARPESFSPLKAKGMLLVDSGGQYLGATTDITRTFVLGELTQEEKQCFTLTAVSMLRLMKTKFIKGCNGENVDIIARAPMWENGLDYKCGTGHGVGCCLNVHEAPHRIKWKITDGRSAQLAPGMFVTDEPGVYKEGVLGVRLENQLLVKPYMSTPDGEFLQFENLTFIPIDPDGIDEKYMNEEDIRLYKAYQKEVFEKIAPHIDEELRLWLKDICRA